MPTRKFIIILLIVITVFLMFTRVRAIKGTMPYPGHIDEYHLTKSALGMLQTGDFNPHDFFYPSLPFYLTTVGFTFGYFLAAADMQVMKTGDIVSVTYPYYSPSLLVWPARLFFSVASVLALLLAGYLAWGVHARVVLVLLVPILGALSPTFFNYSYKYLNVDIVGAFFIMALHAALYYGDEYDNLTWKSVVPGILSGFTIACKYNLVLILVPALLTVLLRARTRRTMKIVLLVLVAFAAFILATPFALLDFNTFLDEVGYQIYVYKEGHIGFEGEPGWPQFLRYNLAVVHDFGWWSILFMFAGLYTTLRHDWKKGIILLSFPLLTILLMSAQKINFVRNILSYYLFWTVFAGIGLVECRRILLSASRRVRRLSEVGERTWWWLGQGFQVLLVLVFFPVGQLLEQATLLPDSRNLASQWMADNLEQGAKVLLPRDLGFAPDDRLWQHCYLSFIEYRTISDQEFRETLSRFSDGYLVLPVFGRDARFPVNQRIIDELNAYRRFITPVKEFGSQVFQINGPNPLAHGDPRFILGKISLPRGPDEPVPADLESDLEGQPGG